MKPKIRKQIGARDQSQKFIIVHYDGDAATIKHPQEIFDFCTWRERLDLGGHRIFHRIIKMRWIAVDLYQHIGLIQNPNGSPALIDDWELRDIGVAHAFKRG